MKLDIKVENLGVLKKGTVKIRPLTVITGENATGKSFFTKTMYSVFNVLNENILHKSIFNDISFIKFLAELLIKDDAYNQSDKKTINAFLSSLLEIESDLLDAVQFEDIDRYVLQCSQINVAPIDKFYDYLEPLDDGTYKQLRMIIDDLRSKITDPENQYTEALSSRLDSEIKDNFQIANIGELVSKNSNYFKFKAYNFELGFDKNGPNFLIRAKFINEITNFSRIVFFETPVYWRLIKVFDDAKNNRKRTKDLSGVPKYFFDLKDTLQTKSKNSPISDLFKISDEIEIEIGGKFTFEHGNLTFIDKNGDIIDANLISAGMTNLGIFGLLLKHNVIDKGSYVFFDEPESNLHPQWQVLLADVFIKLAENGVNVVMATHSLDMIKALEVKTKGKDKNFIAVNHFTKKGSLLKFDSDDITENLITSRNELAKPYERLFLKELYNYEND